MDIVEKVIYIISSHDNPDTIWKEQRNSLYSENENGTIFFNSKKIKKYIVEIKWIKLNLDETFVKTLLFLA